jgi:hypothetical protein
MDFRKRTSNLYEQIVMVSTEMSARNEERPENKRHFSSTTPRIKEQAMRKTEFKILGSGKE